MGVTTPNNGKDLLDSVIAAHGGLERWKRVSQIKVKWLFHGAVLDLKGFPGVWTIDMSIQTQGQPSTTLTGLGHGAPGESWHLSGSERIWIEDPSGSVVKERFQPRDAYGKTPQLTTPWSDLDLTYFVSYAMYNYCTVPFIFTNPGFSVRELDPWHEPGNKTPWRVLEVTHPDNFPTHSKVQRFYFGDDFLLRRLNYEADVLGGVAAHYVYDYKRVDGLAFPTLRRVVSRDPSDDSAMLGKQTAFGLHFLKIEVVDSDGKASSEATRVPTF